MTRYGISQCSVNPKMIQEEVFIFPDDLISLNMIILKMTTNSISQS